MARRSLAAILGIVFVLPAIDRAVPADRAAPAQRHVIAEGISVIPPTGALIAKRTRARPTSGSVLFLIGPARYVIAGGALRRRSWPSVPGD